jgi:hypothetical protein
MNSKEVTWEKLAEERTGIDLDSHAGRALVALGIDPDTAVVVSIEEEPPDARPQARTGPSARL